MSTPTTAGTARRAGPDDAEALARLRAVMLGALESDACVGLDAAWHRATAAWFVEQVSDHESFAAFVVEDPGLGPASCAVGSIRSGPSRPGGLGPRSAEVFSVATHPDARRRGYARACMTELLSWIDHRGVHRIRLTATPDAVGLYRALGFDVLPWTPMARNTE